MNKLVSKNPVLRFKLGKLIVKALGGVKIFGAEMGPQSSRIVRAAKPYVSFAKYFNPLGSVAAAYDIYNAVPKNILNDFYYGYDRDAYLKKLNKLKVKRNTPREITKNGKRFWYGSDGSMTDLELYNKRNRPNSESGQSIETVTVTPRTPKPSVAPTYYATRAYRNRALPEGLNSRAAVMEYLKKLNKLGANIKVDGIWGDKTQAAYLLYGRFNPGHDDDKVQAQILGSNPTTTVVDTASIDPSIVTTVPTNNWIAKVNSLNNLHYNIDPIFKAKQGAKLVSRNPVERFLQGRNLPTAPKAEDRYKNSSRSSEITPQGEKIKTVKVAPTGYWKFPATILERVNQQNDTTYIEVPTHTSILGGLIRPRVHARTVIRKANQPYNIGTYLTFTPSFVGPLFSPSDKLEYETLKRRFNTAWNLAK